MKCKDCEVPIEPSRQCATVWLESIDFKIFSAVNVDMRCAVCEEINSREDSAIEEVFEAHSEWFGRLCRREHVLQRGSLPPYLHCQKCKNGTVTAGELWISAATQYLRDRQWRDYPIVCDRCLRT